MQQENKEDTPQDDSQEGTFKDGENVGRIASGAGGCEKKRSHRSR